MLFRIYTENKNREWLEEFVSRTFKGFTIIEATGYWKGERERSLLIEIAALPHYKPVVEALASTIAYQNKQEACLVLAIPADAELVRAGTQQEICLRDEKRSKMPCNGVKYCPESCVMRMEGRCRDFPPKGRGQAQTSIDKTLEVLERVPCQFWACEGWEAGHQDMKTCFVCDEIIRLRNLKKAVQYA